MAIHIKSLEMELASSHLRLIRWKLSKLKKQFKPLKDVRVLIRKDIKRRSEFVVTVKIYLEDRWMIFQQKNCNLNEALDAIGRGAYMSLSNNY